MHNVAIRQEIIDRVLARRGRLHWFDRLDPRRTALVVVDMQNTFCEPGAPAEVPVSRAIVEPINLLSRELRALGVPIIWVLHANMRHHGRSDWEIFFDHVVANEVRERTIESLAPGRQEVWSGLDHRPEDITIIENRYSALIHGSSNLEQVLRNLGIELVAHRGHQDKCLLRGDGARRHDARFQGCDGGGLLCGLVGRRTPRRPRNDHPAIRRRHDERGSANETTPRRQFAGRIDINGGVRQCVTF